MDQTLKQIWASVLSLEVEEIGDDDNLFELGGDSVKAIIIMGEAAGRNIDFDIETFYAHPTIRGLANFLSSGQSPAKESSCLQSLASKEHVGDEASPLLEFCWEDVGVSAANISRVAPVDIGQEHYMVENEKGIPGSSLAFAYEVQGGPDVHQRLQRAIEVMSTKNPTLRSIFIRTEEEEKDTYYQVLLKAGHTTINHPSSRLEDYVAQSRQRTIHPGDPIVQYALVEEGGSLFFIFSISHAFFDGFSRTLWEQDWLNALKAPETFANEQPERPWFGDFTMHRKETLDESAAENFWTTYLGESCLETIHAGKPETFHIHDSVLHTTLPKTLVKGRSVHIATIILPAWSLALMKYSGKRDVAFLYATLGRLYPFKDIDQITGFLLRSRLFRLQVNETNTDVPVDVLLESVQKDLISAGRQEHVQKFPYIKSTTMPQSYVNIKAGTSSLKQQRIDESLVVTPRRDLEHWVFFCRFAIYLDIAMRDNDMLVELRYESSLLPAEGARQILDDFATILKRIVGSYDTTLGALVESSYH
ncbi:condensation domain-containing protein [Aspergillus parasiticus]|uniref:Condensation domain-containing protein n=1 Tax=Aspergillus parasiticus TaxID=5067 RepID=A0A5N6D478_ASPPA|nr:condensation domain-containing protein [Aspergillus parasiticus]